jgi:hypothetical protein
MSETYCATGSAAADNAVVFTVPLGACETFDTFQIGSTAGAMDVFGSGDGTTFLSDAIAMIDLNSTTPATAVVETTAGKHFGFRGKYRAIRVLQKGVTAVVGAYLNAYQAP